MSISNDAQVSSPQAVTVEVERENGSEAAITQQKPRRNELGQLMEKPPWSPMSPGVSGNPKGRPSMGATFAEWVNALNDKSEEELEAIASDRKAGANKRAAAGYCLEHMERKLEVTKELCDRTEGKAIARTVVSTDAAATSDVKVVNLIAGDAAMLAMLQRLAELATGEAGTPDQPQLKQVEAQVVTPSTPAKRLRKPRKPKA